MARAPDRKSETLLIASWLEAELVERIRAVSPRVEVMYVPDLLRPPRYPADHGGREVSRSDAQEKRWKALLGKATILFDFDSTHRQDLPELAPNVRWIQSTSSGWTAPITNLQYIERMPKTIFTTASGVHAIPLAEFAVMSMLMHTRRTHHMIREQSNKHWARFAGTDLAGRTVVVVGLGSVGSEIARVAKALRMRVLGIRRQVSGQDNSRLQIDAVYSTDALVELLPEAEFLVLIAPQTDETEGMIGAKELALLPRGAVLINISRGVLVDEPSLVASLEAGHLGGAYLDVFATEPLHPDSPLWAMPNVLISPHSSSTSDRENERIVELFCENLRRYLERKPLLNAIDPERGY